MAKLVTNSLQQDEIPGSAAPVTSTADSVATEIKRVDKEIRAGQNTDPGTLLVSSTPVPPLNVQDDRPMASISVGRGDIRVGIDYVYGSPASPAGESPVHEASGTPEHVNSAHEEPTSPLPTQDIALESSNSAEPRDKHQHSGLADQDTAQADSCSDETRRPGEDFAEKMAEQQPSQLAVQATDQTGRSPDTDSGTAAVRVEYHSPIRVDDMTIYISYMHGFL